MNKKIEKLLDEKIAELDSNPVIKQKNRYGKYLRYTLRLLA